MLNAGLLIIREYQLDTIQPDARRHVVKLFADLIRFEATVTTTNVPEDPFTMNETIEEVLFMVERCILGYINERPVAMMLIDRGSPYTIAALYVVEEARSKGVGELLIGCLQSRYPTQQLSVDCYARNTRALNFYNRLGFRFTERSGIMKGVRNAF